MKPKKTQEKILKKKLYSNKLRISWNLSEIGVIKAYSKSMKINKI